MSRDGSLLPDCSSRFQVGGEVSRDGSLLPDCSGRFQVGGEVSRMEASYLTFRQGFTLAER